MASIPQPERTETIAVKVTAIRELIKMRSWQQSYRVRYDGPKLPKLILMEADVDKLFAGLPHEGMRHELVDMTAEQIDAIVAMRRLQAEARKSRRFSADREMSEAQRAVDAMLAGLNCPRIALESRKLVAAGAHDDDDDDDEDERPATWSAYKDN